MISLKKRSQGFTIVELLIVIVVIGILAAIVITTYAGIQSKARDAKRQTDIESIQTNIEAFYSQNGYYPSNADLNSQSWRKGSGTTAGNMPSLDPTALVDPQSTCDPTASGATCVTDTATASAKSYAYYPTDSSGNSCESDDTTCSQYTLSAYLENASNGSNQYQKHNLD